MARIGNQLLRDSKTAVAADEETVGKLEKSALKRRDLLSLLVRANMSTDLPPSQRMSDEDVLARKYLGLHFQISHMDGHNFRIPYVPGCWS
jgi:hypothetical protein